MTRASDVGDVVLDRTGLPDWLDPVVRAVAAVRPTQLSRFLPPEDGGGRQSAVLILFGAGERGPELLLMERAGSLRSHAGQPAFPGGALDPEDGDPAGDGPLRAALREAEEETGLDPAGVQLFGVLPKLYIPVSEFVVTPVLAWWREPSPVGVVDPNETARVFTVPVADLTDPANRATAVHPGDTRARHSWSNRPWCGGSPPASSTVCCTSRAGSGPGTATGRSRWTGTHDKVGAGLCRPGDGGRAPGRAEASGMTRRGYKR
jgi:8-oxo-dGTP pyrophosphatase MutT (NUDIX family)